MGGNRIPIMMDVQIEYADKTINKEMAVSRVHQLLDKVIKSTDIKSVIVKPVKVTQDITGPDLFKAKTLQKAILCHMVNYDWRICITRSPEKAYHATLVDSVLKDTYDNIGQSSVMALIHRNLFVQEDVELGKTKVTFLSLHDKAKELIRKQYWYLSTDEME